MARHNLWDNAEPGVGLDWIYVRRSTRQSHWWNGMIAVISVNRFFDMSCHAKVHNLCDF